MSAAENDSAAEIIKARKENGTDVCARNMYRRNARSYLKLNKILAQNKEIIAFLRKLEWKVQWNNFVQKLWK